MEMKRRLRFAVPLAAALLAACSNGDLGPRAPDPVPLFTATDPFNGEGACMFNDGNDWPQFISGWSSKSDPTATNNCTSNDVRLANARATHFSHDGDTFTQYDELNPPSCQGSTIHIRLVADVQETATANRHDIGIWIRTDAGSTQFPLSAGARSGECNHYNLPLNTVGSGLSNPEPDECMGLRDAGTINGFELGDIEVPCIPTAENKLLINSCVAWKVDGDEGAFPKGSCPAYTTTGSGKNVTHTLIPGQDGFRAGTLPGNTSKCNCEGFTINILVPTNLTIEKQTIGGTASFDYTVSGSGLSPFSRNTATQGNPTVTSAFEFNNTQFGDKYVTETALAGWTLTGISCQADGAAYVIGTGQGAAFSQGATAEFDPGDNTVKVTVGSGDTPTCTFVNTRNSSSLDIEKQTSGGFGTFNYTTSGAGLVDFARTTAAGTNPSANAPVSFSGADATGDKYVTETVPAGWSLTGISCSAGGGASYSIGTGVGAGFANNGSDNFDAGDNTVKASLVNGGSVSCTYTNTLDGSSLDIEKQTVGGFGAFNYTTSGAGLSNFSRTTVDGGNPTATVPISFSGADATGDKYVTETVPAGWSLTGISCSASGGASYSIGTGVGAGFANSGSDNFDAGDNTVKASLVPGGSVSCTYTNTLDGSSLDIEKQTVGGFGTFNYTTSGDGLSNFSRTTASGSNPSANAPISFSGADATGDKYVTETVPAGWSLTGISCSASGGASYAIGTGVGAGFANNGSDNFNAGDNTVKASLVNGGSVSCTYTNTSQPDALFILIDEDGIDNGPSYWEEAGPFTPGGLKSFTASEVNDDIPHLARRMELRYFTSNPGKVIWLWSGQVGDEGWFAMKTIPANWVSAGPTSDGLRNFLGNPSQPFTHNVGSGLGTGNNPESRLDKIANVTPLRAEGLYGLIGKTVCALVWDSDISINYGPLNGSLKGEKLGVAAFEVQDVVYLPGFSSSTLPRVKIEIKNAYDVCEGSLSLYTAAPTPSSSSVPADIRPNDASDNAGYVQ